MRVLLALVVLLLVSGCVSQPRRSVEALVASLDQPYYGEASDAGRDAGVNYRVLMQRAVKRDPIALRRLVHLCTDRHFDGAGLEVHAQYLRALLELWGDAPFAGVLHDLSAAERRELRWVFSHTFYPGFSHSYPDTARVVYATQKT